MVCNMGKSYDVIFIKENNLAGVIDVINEKDAIVAASAFWEIL